MTQTTNRHEWYDLVVRCRRSVTIDVAKSIEPHWYGAKRTSHNFSVLVFSRRDLHSEFDLSWLKLIVLSLWQSNLPLWKKISTHKMNCCCCEVITGVEPLSYMWLRCISSCMLWVKLRRRQGWGPRLRTHPFSVSTDSAACHTRLFNCRFPPLIHILSIVETFHHVTVS